MEKPPCVECERRSPACWGSCDQYKAWKAQLQATKDAKKRLNHVEDYHAVSVEKARKRNKHLYGQKKGYGEN